MHNWIIVKTDILDHVSVNSNNTSIKINVFDIKKILISIVN